jgi:hypothetical protein
MHMPARLLEAMIASLIAHQNHERHSYIKKQPDSRRFHACELFPRNATVLFHHSRSMSENARSAVFFWAGWIKVRVAADLRRRKS